jgi:GntR family transcriptional regulator
MACNDHQVSPDRPRQPPSRRIADDLRRRLAGGEWTPGTQLPGNAALAEHYATTRRTISRAMAALAQEGWVEIEPRWGTFAAQRPPG